MPQPMFKLEWDNDSVFINETVWDYCLDEGTVFTHCRPYRKNDLAYVEQKDSLDKHQGV